MLTVNRRLPRDDSRDVPVRLALDAEERARSRYRFTAEDGTVVELVLDRGTRLAHGDLLGDAAGTVLVRVVARPEPVMVVSARSPADLVRAAYHLGNRHVALQLAPDALLLKPDHVLERMLRGLGLDVRDDVAPFQPEGGAYLPHHHQGGHGVFR